MALQPAAPDRATYRALAGESRQALLAALRRAGTPLDAAEAGTAVGLHPNTARVHLELLCSAGLLHRRTEDRSRRGRPRVLYALDRTATEVLDHGRARQDELCYRDLARLLAQQLSELPDVASEAVQAGRRWAAVLKDGPLPKERLSAPETMRVATRVLERMGFDPEADLSTLRILLHRCPVADVARENGSLVCGIHFGMLKATVERLDSTLGIVSVEGFTATEPSLCVVHLGARTEPPRQEPPLE